MTQTDPVVARAREIAAKLNPKTLPAFLDSLTVWDEQGKYQNVVAVIRDALDEERKRALEEATKKSRRGTAGSGD